MSKFLSMLVPALALTLATVQSSEAEAAPHSVRAHAKAPNKAPAVTKVWVPGHLELRAGRIIWVSGHYKVAPRAHAVYVKGHWEKKRGKRVWVAGYWR